MSGNIAITGVPTTPGAGGSVPLRREIRDLQRNFPDQFNLYVLGLQHLQGLDENQLTSFYQIAGIHGLPYKPWNGVGSNTDWQRSSGFGGYCTHSSILFITWHRPYLALYEVSEIPIHTRCRKNPLTVSFIASSIRLGPDGGPTLHRRSSA